MSIDESPVLTTGVPEPRIAGSAPRVRLPVRLPILAVAALVLAGVALRFVSVGPLWLDEAQSVSIAKVPLHLLPSALRHDGAPPLWYAMLHGWMAVFGDSTFSVRLMSSIPAVLSLPLAASFARRLGGRDTGRTTLVLLATSPFAIRYAVEARMYSLLVLLSLLGGHALLSVRRSAARQPWLPALGVAASMSALLYTHYYAIWLGLVIGAGEAYRLIRHRDTRSWWVLGALAVAAISFVPWLPVLRFQTSSTGAPWLPPPSFNAVLDTVSSWAGGSTPLAHLVQLAMIVLVILAVLGRRGTRRTVVIGPPVERVPLRLLGVVSGLVLIAIIDAMITKQAYAPRYTSLVVVPFLVVVAMGVQVLPTQRLRRGVIVAISLCGLGIATSVVAQPRTQVASAAAALRTAHPGDVVVYCPDQLGPSTSRLLPSSQRLRQVVYPDLSAPQRVDWVDWASRQSIGDPMAVAQQVNQLAGPHQVWLLWAPNYRFLGSSCEDLVNQLSILRGNPYIWVHRQAGKPESLWVDSFAPRR